MDNEYTTGADLSRRIENARKVMVSVYGWMTLALIISAVTGFIICSNVNILLVVFQPIVYWGMAVVEFGLVLFLSARLNKMSSTTAKISFMIYAILNGSTFAVVLMAYGVTGTSYAFLVTAVTFGIMAIYGHVTKTDLSKIGNLLLMALVGLVIAMLFNLIFKNDAVTSVLDCIGVVIFVGLVGYDANQIKRLAYEDGNSVNNIAVYGALNLYLDFINIFIRLARLASKNN